ncbi:MAG: ABC transporter substrate-binding protein [Acidobacteriota bacterium]
MRKGTRNSVIAAIAILAAGAGYGAFASRRHRPSPGAPGAALPAPATAPAAAPTPARGGALVASVHTDPKSFNRYLQRDSTTDLITTLIHGKLVRLNRVTQDVDPWLAESWTRAADGLSYTLALRQGVAFSDGHPFTADDVLFSLEAAYDERTGSVIADTLTIGGRRLRAAAPDPLTVVVTFPEPFAPGLRILDNLPLYPRHVLAQALRDGTFAAAWGAGTPPDQLVGLGPFVVSEYAPGQRMVFSRNSRYWRRAGNGDALPYLDRVTLEIIPDQDLEVLRLDAGLLDMTATELRAEDYAPLRRAADAGELALLDLGVGFDADSLWFNLRPTAGPGDPRAAWLRSDQLRRAISLAVDRDLFANTVFLGAGVPAYGPITAANRKWHADLPPLPHDPAAAARELAGAGLSDRDGDGLLEDAAGRPARFALLTQKGNTTLERGAAVIRDELRKIGLAVDVVALDGNAVIGRFLSGEYDAVYFRITTTDTDPAVNSDFWLSSGSSHIWNPEQKTPATGWEGEIDALMRRQMAAFDDGERKRLFDQVQAIFARHLPTIQFVAPRVFVAVSSRVTNLAPTAFSRPQLLWSPDTIAVVR